MGASPAEKEKFIDDLYAYFIKKGASPTGAQYLLGSLLQESNLDPTAVERLKSGKIGKGRGWVQWSNTKKAKSFAALVTFAKEHGEDWTDFQAQAEFIRNQNINIWAEFRNAQPDTGDGPWRSKSGEEAVRHLEHFGVKGHRFDTAVLIHQNIHSGQNPGHGLGGLVSNKLQDLPEIIKHINSKFTKQTAGKPTTPCIQKNVSAKVIPKGTSTEQAGGL